MGRREIVTCDRCTDEEEALRKSDARPLLWEVGGSQHEIDVCETHERELALLREQLDDYVKTSRPIERTTERRAARSDAALRREAARRSEAAAIREWAEAQGIAVNPGRLPNALREQYATAQLAGQAEPPPAVSLPGALLRQEAAASVALDRDQTHSVEERPSPLLLAERPVLMLCPQCSEPGHRLDECPRRGR
jgi:hypothetical protein